MTHKLYYSGASTTRNGVGIILHSEWQDKILEVKRKSDRVMSIKLVVGKRMLNIISAYAPQTGCSQEEKEHFYEEMESLLRQIPGPENMWIGADLNGHVGGTRTGFGREHEGNEGEEILQFAQANDLGVVNTFFQKKMGRLITYMSGRRRSVIDYILIRSNDIIKVKDCKVIPGESIATQHRILMMDICIQTKKRVKPRRRKQQIKWWRLRDREETSTYASRVEENIKDIIIIIIIIKVFI